MRSSIMHCVMYCLILYHVVSTNIYTHTCACAHARWLSRKWGSLDMNPGITKRMDDPKWWKKEWERKRGGARNISFTSHTDTSSFRSWESPKPNAIAGYYADRLDHSCSPYSTWYPSMSFMSSTAQLVVLLAWSFEKSKGSVLCIWKDFSETEKIGLSELSARW